MRRPTLYTLGRQHNIRFVRFLGLFFLSSIIANTNLVLSDLAVVPSTPNDSELLLSLLTALPALNGHFSFHDVHQVAKDFGNRCNHLPAAVLHPKSVQDISRTLKYIYQMGSTSKLRVAARGHGHSLQGQALAPEGIVIAMEALQGSEMRIHRGEAPYVDVSGGELWIDVLHETLKHGLAPKSWTDYLYLTVGGTLSNAGISGQAFRHGPQVSNVHQLEVVTGKGEVVTCSEKHNADLFYGVLGGLGQFGIITRARVALEAAPKMVRWIRVLYSDFSTFSRDQEMLISAEKTFDYIEGFVIINRMGLLNNWRSSFNPEDPSQASQFKSDGRTLYCLELTRNFDPEERNTMEQEVKGLLSKLSYIPSTLFATEVSYVDFLDRVHVSEMKLRSKGLWEVPHPWLNLLVPGSKIQEFAAEVFGNILADNSNGPILVYPVNKSKWNNNTSVVTPSEEIFYLVAFLSSAVPSSGSNSLGHILARNKKVLDYCERANTGVKQYLPHYATQEEWKAHYGNRWGVLARRKALYDPLAILAPGQKIFQRRHPSTDSD